MVSDMLAQADAPRDFVRYLVQESEGNPFFVSEYLRTAVDDGLLVRDDQGQWHLEERDRGSFDHTLALPHSLKSLVQRRLSGLLARALPRHRPWLLVHPGRLCDDEISPLCTLVSRPC